MANLKSSKKDIRKIAKKTPKNHEYKATFKNAIKALEKAIVANDLEKASEYLKTVQKTIDVATSKNLVSKKTAGRQKSRLNKKVKEMK